MHRTLQKHKGLDYLITLQCNLHRGSVARGGPMMDTQRPFFPMRALLLNVRKTATKKNAFIISRAGSSEATGNIYGFSCNWNSRWIDHYVTGFFAVVGVALWICELICSLWTPNVSKTKASPRSINNDTVLYSKSTHQCEFFISSSRANAAKKKPKPFIEPSSHICNSSSAVMKDVYPSRNKRTDSMIDTERWEGLWCARGPWSLGCPL